MNIKRVIAATALAVVPLTVSSTALATPVVPHGNEAAAVTVPAQVSQQGATYADTVLTKVNELRTSLGLQPVTRFQELDAVAQEWSEHQASTNTMEHRSDFSSYPEGWTVALENVAWRTDGGDIGDLIFEQWRTSPGHYQNMINPDVNSIGIGFAQASNGRWYATQNFAAYNLSNAPLTPTSTSSTPPSTTTSSNTPPTTDTTVSTPQPTPSDTPSTPTTETTPPAQAAPPTTETTTETTTAEGTPTPSAPATTVTTRTTTGTGTPDKSTSTPAVAAPGTTPTKPALAMTGPSIAVAVVAAGLLGTGVVIVMRRRHAS